MNMYVFLTIVFFNGHLIAQTRGAGYDDFESCRAVAFTSEIIASGEVVVTTCEKVK